MQTQVSDNVQRATQGWLHSFLVTPKHKLLKPVVFNPAPPPRGETLVFKENLVEKYKKDKSEEAQI